MSSYHCRFDDKDRTAASGFYDVADRLLTLDNVNFVVNPVKLFGLDCYFIPIVNKTAIY